MQAYIFAILISKKKEHYEQTKLIINSNGSIKIEGDFEIIDCDGIVYGSGRKNGLCRCGLSLTNLVMVHTAVVLNMNLRYLICHPMKTK
jgi:hypothetical protein